MRKNLLRIPIRPATPRPTHRRANLGPDQHLPAALHRVHGVEEKVEKNLFELVGIGVDCINIRLRGTS